MAQSVHGRNVLKMVLASDRSWPRAELLQAMVNEFGADSEFHTCSVDSLSAEQLLDLFLNKGKLVETAEGLSVDTSKMCSHH